MQVVYYASSFVGRREQREKKLFSAVKQLRYKDVSRTRGIG